MKIQILIVGAMLAVTDSGVSAAYRIIEPSTGFSTRYDSYIRFGSEGSYLLRSRPMEDQIYGGGILKVDGSFELVPRLNENDLDNYALLYASNNSQLSVGAQAQSYSAIVLTIGFQSWFPMESEL